MAEPTPDPAWRDRITAVKWLIASRLVVTLLCLVIILLRSMTHTDTDFAPGGILLLLVSLLILNLGYLLILPHVRENIAAFVAVQFLIDIIVESGLVFFTGGVDSNLVNLYYLSIIAAPMLLSRRDSAIFASLATIGLATIYVLYRTGTGLAWVAPMYHPSEADQVLPFALFRLILVTVSFFVIAFLSGLLAQRLELARSLNEEVLQNMAEGLAVFDNRNCLLYANTEFESIFSPTRQMQVGDPLHTIFPHAEDDPLRRLITARTTARFELNPQGREGHERPPLEVRTSSLGTSIVTRGMIMLAIDLSTLRRAEAAEFQAERFSAVTEMAASLAHEIRNPLTAVRGSIQEIGRDFPPNSANRKLCDIVIKESDRLNRIITSFLQYARTRPLHPTDCDIVALLTDLRLLLKNHPNAAAKTITLTTRNVPHLRGDPEQLEEVFLNLGVNALAAMETGGTLMIQCPAEAADSPTQAMRAGVTVSFQDDGRGLPPGAAAKIFEPFYTTKSTGSGLGLAVAQRVVKAHEGKVWVRSEPNQGACFYVWLPFAGPFTPGAPLAE